jgi:hypothetical protein
MTDYNTGATVGSTGYTQETTQGGYYDYEEPYTETKEFFRTSEFWASLLLVVGVLLAAYSSGEDTLSLNNGWRYASFITIGYVVSRGLAKAGSVEPRNRHRG